MAVRERFSGQPVSEMALRRSDFGRRLANRVQIESWGPFAEGRNNMFQNEELISIAREHKKTVAQVILRWLAQRRVVGQDGLDRRSLAARAHQKSPSNPALGLRTVRSKS